MEKLHYCYILRCADQSLYTGYATEPQKRLAAHNSGKGAKYTKAHGPCSLVYLEAFESKEEAMRREYEIKHRFSKQEKEALILPCTGMGQERLLEYALSLVKDKKDALSK